MKNNTSKLTDPVAVVGMACRFPGRASSLSGFWDVLEKGLDEISQVPEGRFSFDRFYSRNTKLAGHSHTLSAGIIGDIKEFDPDFFGISRKEALDMDPQQRLALELAWECLEQAQVKPSALRGKDIGVYFGASSSDNSLQIPDDPCVASPYSMTGSNLSIVSNRISHVFDLHGPSLTVDTACSSSLLAVHLACEALRSGEIPLAIAGGVNILLAPYGFIGFSKAHMLSPDGRCKVFDASGNGYVRSEGGGCLFLKPLSLAVRDDDDILGLIAGSGANSDGRTTGIALPNGDMQAELLSRVYDRFRLDKNKLVYVEAHGTGTAAGDPVEARSIGRVLGMPLKGRRVLHTGSVKSNIGHLEAASGMAGIIKAILILQHGKIPANLHFTTPNPDIDFDELNIRVPRKLLRLPGAGGGELISVNSFGFGGTNAHVVLQRASKKRMKRVSAGGNRPLPPLLLSASSPYSLRRLAHECAAFLAGRDAAYAYNFAASFAYGRDELPIRKIIQGKTVSGLVDSLEAFSQSDDGLADLPALPGRSGTGRGVFVFSGNGSQWRGMGKALFNDNACFRQSIEEMDALLSKYQKWSLAKAFSDPDSCLDVFDRAEINQPMLFALQVGLVTALKEKGLEPSAVIGHSVGEVAAAWAAGALSLKDAAKVIYYRSALQGTTHGKGRMAVANMSAERAEPLIAKCGGRIEISAVNSPASITVSSSDTGALSLFLDLCKKWRIAAKKLDLPYPYHTSVMDEISGQLLSSLAGLEARVPDIPFFSTVYGAPLHSPPDAEYWFLNIRKPVLFAPAVMAALRDGHERFLEIGPHPVLRSYLRGTLSDAGSSISILPSLLNNDKEVEAFEATWAKAWQQGWSLNAATLFPTAHHKVALPDYPWNREYLWPDDTAENHGFLKQERVHPLLGWPLSGKAPGFENLVSLADFPWLRDHVVGNGVVYPAAAFLESVLAAACHFQPDRQVEIDRLSILRPLSLEENGAGVLRLLLDKEDGGLRIESRKHMSAEPWGTYVKGRILPLSEYPADSGLHFTTPESFGMEINLDSLYGAKRTMLRYGRSFRTVEKAWMRPDVRCPEVLSKLALPEEATAENMLVPPTLVDGAMQSLFVLLAAHKGGKRRTYLPVSFDKVVLFSRGTPRYAHTRLERIGARSIVATFRLMDQGGSTLLLLKDCRFRRALWLEHEHADSRPYTLELVPQAHPDIVTPLKGAASDVLIRQAQECISQAMAVTRQDGGLAAHPYLLLQLAALSSVHENVLDLCGDRSREPQCGSRELVDAGLLAPVQELWFTALLGRLEAAELASGAGDDRWKVRPLGDRVKASVLWRTLVSTSPAYLPEAGLLAHSSRQYAALFSRSRAETPDSVLHRLSLRYFSNSTVLAPFIKAAARVVESVLMTGRSGQNINILHIAKNPTDLLSDLLPALAARPCRYVVAEKDEASAEAHAIQFGASPSLEFAVLDPEAPGCGHGGRYHLILLLWSLHEYLNSAKVLEACQEMLAPGGKICIIEHNANVFTDYAFGSSPAWWAASPSLKHPVSLLQGPGYWQKALAKARFESVRCTETGGSYAPAFLVIADKAQEDAVQPALGAEACAEKESVNPEAGAKKQLWLIIAAHNRPNSQKLAEAIAGELRAKGQQTQSFLYSPQDIDTEEAVEHWWRQCLGWALREPDSTALQVVFLAMYDNRQDIPEMELLELQSSACVALTGFSRTWEALRQDMRFWLVSGGGLADGIGDAEPVPSQGGLAGFLRVLGNEIRRMPATLLDVHGDDEAALRQAHEMAREMLHPTQEREVVFSRAGRHVPRLTRLKARQGRRTAEAGKSAALLLFDTPGRLQNLYWSRVPVPVPGPDEVCVEVKYTGLNFRDVMWSVGMLPDEALEDGFSGPSMGMECSGIVSRVGKNVVDLKEGDAVIGFAPACFGSHALTRASAVARKPESMSFSEGATIPVAFMTAWYSLKHLARMQAGESVLIHGAAGGVGLAAIQIASHLGLEVYATAGAAEKHDFLRQLGLNRLYSSRSLAFAQQIREDTGGIGVDAVLNSLAGEAVPAGVSVLRPFGRFLELGKRDFFADSPLRLRPFSNNISFFGIDVDQLLVHQPGLAQSLFSELVELFEARKLAPLPHTVYPVTRTVEAFQTMQQAGHIGKIAVSLAGAADIAEQPESAYSKTQLKADAAYLVTGGSSGFGLASAARLARRGARHIILLSRRGIIDEDARAIVANMRANGVTVIEAKADVTDKQALFACLHGLLASLPPLGGIIHAAAVLDDTLIPGLTEKRIRTALAAKVLGALHLHAFSLTHPVDFFVLYSSVSSAFGNPGQSVYVAANSTLEALGALRRSRGLPAQVIGWGPISDTGMMARGSQSRDQLFRVLGISPSQAHDALYWLEHCIEKNVGDSYYFGLDWHSRADLPALGAPRYNRLRPAAPRGKGLEAPALDEIRALPEDEALAVVRRVLVDEITRVLRLPKDRLNEDSPLVAQGMDSLMAVELAIAVEQKFELPGYNLSLAESNTVKDLAASLLAHIKESAGLRPAPSPDEELVRGLEKKHGFKLTGPKLESVMQSMKDTPHER